MQIHTPIPPPDLVKLFDFLDSETPATREWVMAYFTKQGLHFNQPITSYATLRMQVSRLAAEIFPGSVKEFAKKMGNAWRVKKHRDKNDVVSLSVSLSKTVAFQLSKMSKGHKKSEIITKLIQSNYQEFLAKENERKTKLAEERRIRRLERDNSKSQKQLKQHRNNLSYEPDQSSTLAELRDKMNHLINMVHVMSQENKKNDEASLCQKAETATESGQMHKPNDAILSCQSTRENTEVLEATEETEITSIQSSEVPELSGLEQKLEPDTKSTCSDPTTTPTESAASGVSDAALDAGNIIITSARDTTDTATIDKQPNFELSPAGDNISTEPKKSTFAATRIVTNQASEPTVVIDRTPSHVTTEARLTMKRRDTYGYISTAPQKSSFTSKALAHSDTQPVIERPAGSATGRETANIIEPDIQPNRATVDKNISSSLNPDSNYNPHITGRLQSKKSNN